VIKTYLSRVNKFSDTIQVRTFDCQPTVVKSVPPQISVSKPSKIEFSASARSRKVPGVVFSAGHIPAINLSGRGFPAGSLPGETHGNFSTGL
jgi:hypothetical protein